MFLRHPIIVVVNAELYCVHKSVANIKINPKMHDSKKWNRNTKLMLVISSFRVEELCRSTFKAAFAESINKKNNY